MIRFVGSLFGSLFCLVFLAACTTAPPLQQRATASPPPAVAAATAAPSRTSPLVQTTRSARATPTTTPASADEDLDSFIEESVASLNDFWGSTLRAAGHTDTAPKFVQAAYNQRIRSQCGNSRGSDHSYCPGENTVYVDYDSDDEGSFLSLWDEDRSFVIVATLGHEWGHHVQNQLDIFAEDSGSVEDSRKFELQADCLMGVYLRSYARASDWVERSDLEDVIRDTREAGDSADTPREERDHGTSRERVAALKRGYSGVGLEACGI